MPVSRGYPKGSAAATTGVVGGLGTTGGAISAGEAAATVDISAVVDGLRDIAESMAETPKEVITGLYLSSGQALVVLAGDYKAYFDLTAYTGSILKVAADATAILKIYGDMSIDNSAEYRMDNLSHITIKGD
jgi:hypothetical protein